MIVHVADTVLDTPVPFWHPLNMSALLTTALNVRVLTYRFKSDYYGIKRQE